MAADSILQFSFIQLQWISTLYDYYLGILFVILGIGLLYPTSQKYVRNIVIFLPLSAFLFNIFYFRMFISNGFDFIALSTFSIGGPAIMFSILFTFYISTYREGNYQIHTLKQPNLNYALKAIGTKVLLALGSILLGGIYLIVILLYNNTGTSINPFTYEGINQIFTPTIMHLLTTIIILNFFAGWQVKNSLKKNQLKENLFDTSVAIIGMISNGLLLFGLNLELNVSYKIGNLFLGISMIIQLILYIKLFFKNLSNKILRIIFLSIVLLQFIILSIASNTTDPMIISKCGLIILPFYLFYVLSIFSHGNINGIEKRNAFLGISCFLNLTLSLIIMDNLDIYLQYNPLFIIELPIFFMLGFCLRFRYKE